MNARTFWVHVAEVGNCWEWQGARFTTGYGAVRVGATKVGAHRYAFELVNGPISGDRAVLHRCDNRLCVRPGHLFLGTKADNARDMLAKGRAPAQRLTFEDALEIRRLRAAGYSVSGIAETYSISGQTVRDVIRGHTWTQPLPAPSDALLADAREVVAA